MGVFWGRKISGVRSDHEQDRKPVARKCKKKGDRSNTDREPILYATIQTENAWKDRYTNTGGEHLSERTGRQTDGKIFGRNSHNTI
jgi:hypothetical protein